MARFDVIAAILIDCRKYLEDVRKQTKICVDTFRYGYIGKTVSDMNGCEYTQTRRGKPYGYIAAIQDGDKLYVGYTLLSDVEKYADYDFYRGVAKITRGFLTKGVNGYGI